MFPLVADIGSRRTTRLLLAAVDRIQGGPSGGSTIADAAEALRERLHASS